MGGAGLAIETCVFVSLSSAGCPPLLRDACPSRCVVCSALVGVFRFFPRKGAVGPVSFSPGFFAAGWLSPRRQIGGVRFFP